MPFVQTRLGHKKGLSLLAALAIVLASCGDDSDAVETTAGESVVDTTQGATDTTEADSTVTTEPTDVAEVCQRPSEMTSITVGVRPTLIQAPMYLALARGYFADENLDVTFEFIDAASTNTLLAGGEIDALASSITSGGFFNAIASGFEIRALLSVGQPLPEPPLGSGGFYVDSDLIESGEVKTIADLRGRPIAMQSAVGDTSSHFVGVILETGGLTFQDVVPTVVQSEDFNTAFQSDAIAAAFVPNGWSAQVTEDGSAQLFGDQTVLGGHTFTGIAIGERLMNDPVIAEAFARAIIRATRELGPDFPTDPGIAEELASVVDAFDVEVIRATPSAVFHPDLAINPDSVETVQRIWFESGEDILTYDEPMAFSDFAAVEIQEAAAASVDACEY